MVEASKATTSEIMPAHYSTVAIALHWTIAALIAVNLLLGFTFRSYNHAAQGVSWRLRHPPPKLGAHLSALERHAAGVAHVLLYVLMIGVPFAGWIVTSSWVPPRPLFFWGAPFPTLPLPTHSAAAMTTLRNGAANLHLWLAWALLGLVALHVAGALKHHFLDRDGELARMIPIRTLRARR
jgi:cytochrome b561